MVLLSGCHPCSTISTFKRLRFFFFSEREVCRDLQHDPHEKTVESSKTAVTPLKARDLTGNLMQKDLKSACQGRVIRENVFEKNKLCAFSVVPHGRFKSDCAKIPARSRAFRGMTAVSGDSTVLA